MRNVYTKFPAMYTVFFLNWHLLNGPLIGSPFETVYKGCSTVNVVHKCTKESGQF